MKSVLMCFVHIFVSAVIGIHWDHSVFLNDDYRLLWSTKYQDITFEIQVRTLGYVGFGFSRNGRADVAIGWIDNGQTYFQVRIYNFMLLMQELITLYLKNARE